MNGGSLSGQSYDLETGFLSIGRSDTCSIRFDPMSERIASKQHAFIEARADGFYIRDNQSTNGTLVNGQKIDSVRLNSGDEVQFGTNGVKAIVRIAGGQDAPLGQQGFREFEMQQFNQIAVSEPVNLSNSISNLGLGSMSAVKPEPERKKSSKYAYIAIAIFAIVFLSLVVLVLISSALSPSQNGEMTLNLEGVLTAFLASFVAFIPAMVYILPLIWIDRYDPEPPWLLALAFAWGALVAVAFSFVVNTSLGKAVFALTHNAGAADVIGAVVSAPIFEEGSKGLGVLILLIFFRRYFDDVLDGIVFAGVIALGFATVENVLYYGRVVSPAVVYGAQALPTAAVGLIFSFVLRGIMSPFAHVTFTSMTGIGCGIARESHKTWVRVIMPFVGYCAAVFLHFTWNFAASVLGLEKFIVGYWIIGFPFFCIFVIFTFYVMYRQGKILREMLAIDIARGLISPELGKTVTSVFRSSSWLLGGLFSGKYRARSHYLRAAGKLGLSYWHIQRATAAQGQTGSFQQNPLLRDEVLKWRDQV